MATISDASPSKDFIRRGVKRPSPLATTVFVCLRSLDVFLQYGILAQGLADPVLNLLHVSPVYSSAAPIVAFGLPLKPFILLCMAAGSTIKQIYWQTAITYEELPVSSALIVSAGNTVGNSINSILSVTAAATYFTPSLLSSTDNATCLSPLFILGTTTYVMGMALETISEQQRKNFKASPKNAGKAYTGGLWSFARHINYGGYILWRSGYIFAAGGWIAGAVVAGTAAYSCITKQIPLLDDYCSKRVCYLLNQDA